MLTAYPAMSWLVVNPSFIKLLAVQLWFSLFFAFYNGAMIPYLAEIMPSEVRTAAFSLSPSAWQRRFSEASHLQSALI